MKIENFDKVVILRPKKSYFSDGSRFEGQSIKLKAQNFQTVNYIIQMVISNIKKFKNGMYHGYGEYFNPKLWDYRLFFKNRMHGKGKYFIKRSKIKIDGIFK